MRRIVRAQRRRTGSTGEIGEVSHFLSQTGDRPLAVANKAYRERRYEDAITQYELLLSNLPADAPIVLRQSIQQSIDACDSRLRLLGHRRERPRGTVTTQVVLTVNASHAHEAERRFWSDFGSAMKQMGFYVLDLAFRKHDPFTDMHMVTHPARAHDISKYLARYDDEPVPEWVDDNLISLCVDWEHRRWQLDKYEPRSHSGIWLLSKYIDHLVRTLMPVAILTTNKIDPPNRLAHIAARHYGIEYRFVERSPLDSFIVEDSGMFFESETCSTLIDNLLTRVQQEDESSSHLIDAIKGNPYGFRRSEANRTQLSMLEGWRGPLFFLPLDNILWTGWAIDGDPQGDIDYPVFRNPQHALSTLAREIRKLNGTLIIKPHPSCKEWVRIRDEFVSEAGVEFNEGDLAQLVLESDVVITFLTKVSYLALAHGKPVVSFSSGLLDCTGTTYRVSSPADVGRVLRQALAKKSLHEKRSRFRSLLPYLKKVFTDNGDYAAVSLKPSLVTTYRLSRNELEAKLRSAVRPDQKSQDRSSGPPFPLSQDDPEVVSVVFDVSRLLIGRLQHSGISRYTAEIARRIGSDERLHVTYAYRPQKNAYGMSAYRFEEVRRQLRADMIPMQDALERLDSSSRPYLFHSPLYPLPSKTAHPRMTRLITVHDIFHLTRPEFYDAGNTLTKEVVRSIDNETDGVVFVSDYSRQEFARYVGAEPNSSVVVHLGVDVTFLESGSVHGWPETLQSIPPGSDVLVVPCQGDPRKGFDRMMRIASTWIDGGLHRYVIGFGRARNAGLFSKALRPGSAGRYRYLSEPNDEELAAIYRNSLALLFLSDAEGFGLPPLEAMACGCPTILRSNTSLSEVYRGWPYMLPDDASDSRILATLESCKDYSVRIAAQAFAREYTWARTASSVVAYYSERYAANR